MLHATSARHSSTHAPRNASTAPTAMKTVPSGRVDFCMKGAPAVYGMTRSGTPAPAIVGKPVNPVKEAVTEPVLPVVDEPVVSLVVSPVVVVSAVLLVAVVPPVVALVSPVVASVALVASVFVGTAVACVAVERSGRSFCARTTGVAVASKASSATLRMCR